MSASTLIVTLAIGQKYLESWTRLCEPNWRAYATKHGYDLLCIDHPLDESERAQRRSVSWQKCLVLDQRFARKYDRVVWVDADILINAAFAPPIVAGVPEEKVGAVDAFKIPSRELCLQTLERCYEYWAEDGGNVVFDTPGDYHVNYGLSRFEHDHVVQCGVMVLSPRHHRNLLLSAYYDYEDKGGPEWHYEARPLSYELLKADVVEWIDHRFNQLWLFYKFLHYPFLVDQRADSTIATRVRRRLARYLARSKNRIRSTCATTAFVNSYFLHFGASLNEMEWVDTSTDSWNQRGFRGSLS